MRLTRAQLLLSSAITLPVEQEDCNVLTIAKRISAWFLIGTLSMGLTACEWELGDHDNLPDGPTPEEIAEAEAAQAEANAETPSPIRGGSEEFLWKPISDHGPLVILLPSSLRGRVTSCTLQSSSAGTVAGRFAGDTHNGYRPHYRFDQQGGAYGTGITVTATLDDGSTRSWSVPNGAQRTTH